MVVLFNFILFFLYQICIPLLISSLLCRTSGLTQNDLAKEFGMKGNNIFYLVRGLECHKLITRQSTLLKMKESGIDGEVGSKFTQIVHTNLIHLCRYAKHANLGSQRRIEISRPDMLANPCNLYANSLTENNASGEYLEDIHIEDFLPAMKLICDKLEGADEKVKTYYASVNLSSLFI